MTSSTITKTVAVLGASYGGTRAAQLLAQGLPKNWRVVVVDKNSHMNHLYVLPRYAVLPGHEHKAFIPYNPMFHRPDVKSAANVVILHARVTSLTPHSLTLSRAFPEHKIQDPARTLNYDYAVYALGSHLPAPIDLWGPVGDEKEVAAAATETQGTKAEGIEWLKRFQSRVTKASSVLIVGGGPLGVQYATDIAELFPDKRVTLLHSRARLLPLYDEGMHSEIVSSLAALHVTAILGDRLDLSSVNSGKTILTPDGKQERVVRTLSGREISAELILLCTGQNPNTTLLAQAIPDAVIMDGPKKGMIRVARTMQIAVPDTAAASQSASLSLQPEDVARESLSKLSVSRKAEANDVIAGDEHLCVPYPHLFAIGDAADAFGAGNSGRNAFYQAEVAARNIIRLIERSEQTGSSSEAPELERYDPGPRGIKISLGVKKQLIQRNGKVQTKMNGVADMEAGRRWKFYGVEADDEGMHA